MELPAQIKANARQLADTLKKYRWVWLAPTIAFTLVALIYSVAMSRKWSAKQSFVVREEVGNSLRGLGRFDTNEAMKTAQETIQELARHRLSVESALKTVGPPAGYKNPDAWPAAEDISDTQKIISIFAPNGTEYGKTEVIYISTTAETKERAVLLTKNIGDELEKRLREFRRQKLASIVEEIEKRADVVESDLAEATQRLQEFEMKIGADLGELRTLSESSSGDSNLRNQQIAIRNELRQANTLRESLLQLQEMIDTAGKDPGNLLATPSRLLDAQPGLKKLKESLVEMQAQLAKLSGMMSKEHPRVQEAMNGEKEMRDNMHRELKEAARGVESDLKSNGAQIKSLERQLETVNERLDQLAGSRAQYGNLVSELKRCRETSEKTQRELSDSRAALQGALSANLISRLDTAMAGDRPLGPGRLTIIASGFASGLASGLGLLFLCVPMGQSGRRITDYLHIGRRSSDRSPTRRSNDPPIPVIPQPIAGGRRTSDPPPASYSATRGRRPDDPVLSPAELENLERERRRGMTGRRAQDPSAPGFSSETGAPLNTIAVETPAVTTTPSA